MKLRIVSSLLLCRTLYLLALCICTDVQAKVATQPQRFTVTVDNHPLALWSRTAPHPKHTLLLIHGRTWSALPNFDLHVPDHAADEHSIMLRFAAGGYAVYALDLRGYGKTPRNADGWNTPLQAANDVAQALKWIAQRHPQLDKPALLGWSMGSMVAQLTAQLHGEQFSDLILYGYPRDPAAANTVAPSPPDPMRETNTVERAKSDFISPQAIMPAVIDAYVAAVLQADPIRADWHRLEQYQQLDASVVKNPTLLIHGERDPLTPIAAQARVFVGLGNPDKQWIILPGADHAALIENTQPAFVAAIRAFIERPKR